MLRREGPSFEDYLATGALANVPLWIYILVLTFDTNRYTQSDPTLFFTTIPIVVMVGGGLVASYLLYRRVKKDPLRVGLLVGVTATVINFVFGLATSSPSMGLALVLIAACSFIPSSVFAAMICRRRS